MLCATVFHFYFLKENKNKNRLSLKEKAHESFNNKLTKISKIIKYSSLFSGVAVS